jgi:hypothetical protein
LILRKKPHQPWRHPSSSRGPGGFGRNRPRDHARIGQPARGRPLRVDLDGGTSCLALEPSNKAQARNPSATCLQSRIQKHKESRTLTDDGGAIGDAFRIGGREDSRESNWMGEPSTRPYRITVDTRLIRIQTNNNNKRLHKLTLSKGLDGSGRLIRERRGYGLEALGAGVCLLKRGMVLADDTMGRLTNGEVAGE